MRQWGLMGVVMERADRGRLSHIVVFYSRGPVRLTISFDMYLWYGINLCSRSRLPKSTFSEHFARLTPFHHAAEDGQPSHDYITTIYTTGPPAKYDGLVLANPPPARCGARKDITPIPRDTRRTDYICPWRSPGFGYVSPTLTY